MPFQTEQILKAILDHAPQNIVLTNKEHIVLACNEQMKQTLFPFFGRYMEPGDDYRDFVMEPLMEIYIRAFTKALEGEITVVELPSVYNDIEYWFQYRVNPVFLPGGELLGVSLSAENISQRKSAESELVQSETKFRTLVEQSLVGVFILLNGKFVYVNPAFARILALDAQELTAGYQFADFVHDDDLANLLSCSEKIMEGIQQKCHIVLSAIADDGEVRSIELNISMIIYNNQPALLASALDITDSVNEQMRINEAVDHAQELERIQLGMELHDNIKQLLFSVMLQLRNGMASVPGQEEPAVIGKSIEYLQQAVKELRKLSHRLAPSIDQEITMLEKLKELIERMHFENNIQVQLNIEPFSEQLDTKIQLVIYRIVQEQLTNILHHANALNIKINIRKVDRNIIIKVKDDGVGFDTSKKSSGIGMQNIRRRVQVLGGNVHVNSSPGEGVLLVASMPV